MKIVKNTAFKLPLLILLAGIHCSGSRAIRNEFFSHAPREIEAFQVYADSERYVVNQVNYENSITIVNDPVGEKQFTDEIHKYDKIDRFNEAIFKVQLYEDTGTIAKIRPSRPAEISELNKLIADDITRLQFKFSDDKIEPLEFEIRYGIRLRKMASEQEVEQILKDNVR